MDEAMGRLEAETERGKRFLDRLELAEAEEIFRDILQRVSVDRNPQTDMVIVSSLFGLAEIHSKHCRNVRVTQLDWACGMFFALLFYRTTSETCAKIIRQRSAGTDEQSNRNGSSKDDYFSETLARAKNHANAVEMNLLTALRGKVLENNMPVFTSISIRRKTSSFDDTWLLGLLDFCCRSAAEYQSDVTGNDDTESQLNGDSKGGVPRKRRFSLIAKDSGVEMLSAQPPRSPLTQNEVSRDRAPSPTGSSISSTRGVPNKRVINFDRFQDAIKNFVSDVSQDIRGQYSHISGKIPHGLLEKRVCSELAVRLSSGCDDSEELQTIFENLLTEEDEDYASTMDTMEEFVDETETESSSEDESGDETVETFDLYIKPSAVHTKKEKSTAANSIPLCNGLILYEKVQNPGTSLTIANKTDTKSVNSNHEIKTNMNADQSGISSKKNNTTTVDSINSVNRSMETMEKSTTFSNGRNGVLTKWRHSENENDKTHMNEFCQSSNVSCGFEEVSLFSDRKERPSSSSNGPDPGLHEYISEAKLSQLLAVTAIKLADAFKKETYSVEATQMYKYAYGIFKAYPLSDGQHEMLTSLLVDIGSACCSVGEMGSGSQLMREAAGLYGTSGEVQKQAGVWYQLGNAYLSDSLRQESILAKVMQMIKEDVKKEHTEDKIDDDSSECDSDEGDTYCTCIYDAIDCHKRALEAMVEMRDTGQGQDPDLLANVLTNLADCQMMTGNLEQAEQSYEEALRLFSRTFGASLLQKNAHVLGMVGTLSFLAGNYVRSATMYETSHVLRQHLPDTEEPNLEIAWNITMLALSYHFLGHYHQSVTWCIRAFKLYTRFFRGRLLTVDSLSRWFIVQNLFVLGFAYNSLRLYTKAIHYLNFCKNMIADLDEDQNPDQSVQVYLALGDAYQGIEDKTNADKAYEEARLRLKVVDQDSVAWLILSEEVEGRFKEGQNPTRTEATGRFHEQAVHLQRDAETSIKDEMVSILLRLGFTMTSEKDIDWAIGCYDECVQAYRDLKEPSEAARALASLGTLCQVKGHLQEENSKHKQDDFISKAEKYFTEAYTLVDSTSPVCVQYGNFLYAEGRYLESLQVLLPFVFCKRPEDLELSYTGIEQMALPAHFQRSIEEEETLVVEARVLAKFLALLCFRSLRMTSDVDEVLDELYRTVDGSTKSLNYSLLGYALLECRLFPESAEAFMGAYRLQPESDLACFVAWVTLLLSAYTAMARGLDHFLGAALASGNNDRGTWTFHEKKAYLRRQVSHRSRKISTRSGEEQTTTHLENGGSSFQNPDRTEPQNNSSGHGYGNHDDGSPQNSSPTQRLLPGGAKRNVVIETRRWNPQENHHASTGPPRPQTGCEGQGHGHLEDSTSGTKKKWRSRLYHNLPDTSTGSDG